MDHAVDQRALQMELQYRGLLEAAPDAMIIMNQQGEMVLVNAHTEKLFGYAREELLNNPVEMLLPERYRRDNFAAHGHGRAMREGLELFGLRKDGREFPADIMLTPFEGVDGTLVTAVIRDISIRKAALEQELRMRDELDRAAETDRIRKHEMQMKDDFLSRVSHELRSPLTSIYSFGTLIADGLAGQTTGQQDEYLQIILKNVQQLRAMIEDLLEITKAKAGKLSVEPRRVSVSECCVDAIHTLQGAARAKEIILSFTPSAGLPGAYADPTRFRQVLIILLDNAIKFTPAGGTVKVQARVFEMDPRFLLIEVADTGCGIRPDLTERVFEHLYQAADAGQAGRLGLGLGLHIAKELVTRQGGEIWVESELQRGSRFFFSLPIFLNEG
jgi:PAS domain S-box-containing protein